MMLFLIPAAAAAIFRYLSFRMRYEGTELVIRSGFIFRNERHIPYARIQNLDAVQNVFHRLLRVIEVRIQTGAGAEPEATISVLPASALDEMRRRVFGRELQAETAPRTNERVLLQMPLRELLLHGFLVNRGMVVIGALYGILWQLDLLDRVWAPFFDRGVDEEEVRGLFEAIASGARVSLTQIAVAAAAVAGFLIVVRIASMAWAVVRLYGFRVTEVGDDLRIEYGLLTRFTATIPVRRIQSVTITEGPLYRLADRVSVRVETAGGRAGQDSAASVREWLAPLLRPAQLGPLLADVMREAAGAVGLDRRASAGVPPRSEAARVSGNRAHARRGHRTRVAGPARRGRRDPVERAGGAPLRGSPGMDGLGQHGGVQERLALAQRDDRARVADPGGDAHRIAVRSAHRDGARSRGYGRRQRTLPPHRHSVPRARRRGGAAEQARGAGRGHRISVVGAGVAAAGSRRSVGI